MGNLSEDATNINATFFFEKELQPIVNIARTKVTTLPLDHMFLTILLMTNCHIQKFLSCFLCLGKDFLLKC